MNLEASESSDGGKDFSVDFDAFLLWLSDLIDKHRTFGKRISLRHFHGLIYPLETR